LPATRHRCKLGEPWRKSSAMGIVHS